MARNKITFEKHTGAVLLVSSEEIVTAGNDKWETVKYLKNNSFHYPESCLLPYEIDN